MLFLLRQVRRKLMNENKFTTYLLYGVGEIILVVVGILIAVSIDNWNETNQLREREKVYIAEIRENLKEDIVLIDSILSYNKRKSLAIKEILTLCGSGKAKNEILRSIFPHLDYLFRFQVLSQSRIAFDNMVNAESIAIIKNKDLRDHLSEYYSIAFVNEERTKQLARNLNDLMVPHIVDSNSIKFILGIDTNLDLIWEGIPFYKDPEIIAAIVNSGKNAELQSLIAEKQRGQVQELIRLIDKSLHQ